MDARKLLVALALGSLAMPASAQLTEIFKCRDAQGHWTYTNDRRQAEKEKCELVASQINVSPAQKAARPARRPTSRASRAPSAPPARGASARSCSRSSRAKRRRSTKAQQALAEQESVRSGNERNYARVEERLKPYKESVESHQKNIEALRREIANQNR